MLAECTQTLLSEQRSRKLRGFVLKRSATPLSAVVKTLRRAEPRTTLARSTGGGAAGELRAGDFRPPCSRREG